MLVLGHHRHTEEGQLAVQRLTLCPALCVLCVLRTKLPKAGPLWHQNRCSQLHFALLSERHGTALLIGRLRVAQPLGKGRFAMDPAVRARQRRQDREDPRYKVRFWAGAVGPVQEAGRRPVWAGILTPQA